jgi:putative ABC transport system permease protein
MPLLAAVPPVRGALPLLALQRARFQRRTATAAVAGVVASLALSVALTVMVASFRSGVTQLAGRHPAGRSLRPQRGNAAATDQAWLPASFATQAARARRAAGAGLRVRAAGAGAGRPAVSLIVQPLANPVLAVPLVAPPLPPRPAKWRLRQRGHGGAVRRKPGTLIDPAAGRPAPCRRACWACGATTHASSAPSPSTTPTTAA